MLLFMRSRRIFSIMGFLSCQEKKEREKKEVNKEDLKQHLTLRLSYFFAFFVFTPPRFSISTHFVFLLRAQQPVLVQEDEIGRRHPCSARGKAKPPLCNPRPSPPSHIYTPKPRRVSSFSQFPTLLSQSGSSRPSGRRGGERGGEKKNQKKTQGCVCFPCSISGQ